MNSHFGAGRNRRKRVTGRLNLGPRGLNIVTDAGDLWVLDRDDFDSDLIGRVVVAEGTLAGLDRLEVDWLGDADL